MDPLAKRGDGINEKLWTKERRERDSDPLVEFELFGAAQTARSSGKARWKARSTTVRPPSPQAQPPTADTASRFHAPNVQLGPRKKQRSQAHCPCTVRQNTERPRARTQATTENLSHGRRRCRRGRRTVEEESALRPPAPVAPPPPSVHLSVWCHFCRSGRHR